MDAFVVAVGTDDDIVYSKSTSVQVPTSLNTCVCQYLMYKSLF